jgi:hypothetical protein
VQKGTTWISKLPAAFIAPVSVIGGYKPKFYNVVVANRYGKIRYRVHVAREQVHYGVGRGVGIHYHFHSMVVSCRV